MSKVNVSLEVPGDMAVTLSFDTDVHNGFEISQKVESFLDTIEGIEITAANL